MSKCHIVENQMPRPKSIVESVKDEEATSFYAASVLVSINFVSKDQLQLVPRIGDKVAIGEDIQNF